MMEEQLIRIADALEALVAQGERAPHTNATLEELNKDAPNPTSSAAPSTKPSDSVSSGPDVPVKKAPPKKAPPKKAPPKKEFMSAEELNVALNAEAERLGGGDAIYEAVKSLGVTGVTDLDPKYYQDLLDKVQAL